MEQEKEKFLKSLKMRISIWKELQEIYSCDLDFFHYSQRCIDRMEEWLDQMSRLEKGNGYLSI